MPSSVIRTSTSDSGQIAESPTVSHFVWSASTIRCRAASTSARSVSASMKFGVVRPRFALIPCTPRKTWSTLSERIAATANGPTSASEGVRIPPVRITDWSCRPAR